MSASDAFRYLDVVGQVAGAQVDVLTPQTHGVEALVREHVGTLLLEHGPSLDPEERGPFAVAAAEGVRGAFEDPDADGVLVRLSVPRDGRLISSLTSLVVLAGEPTDGTS